MKCRSCQCGETELVFATEAERSLTSVMKLAELPISVYLCRRCGHLSNGEIPSERLDQFYDEEYDLLMDSEDSQELFLDKRGQQTNKLARSFGPLSGFFDGEPAGRMLDFGCGKGLAVRAILDAYPDWEVHAFEVSERYRDFLSRRLPAERVHLGNPASLGDMAGTFDLVTLFDVLEHVEDPRAVLSFAASLVRPGGHVYIQVPDIYRGELDWLIVDHLSHFTIETMQDLVRRCGLKVCRAEDFETIGSLQVLCSRVGPDFGASLAASSIRAYEYGRAIMDAHLAYWQRFCEALTRILREVRESGGRIAVFGTGTAASVVPVYFPESLELIECFVDENPYRIGGLHHGCPVVGPRDIPSDIGAVFLGVASANVRYVRPKLAGVRCPVVGVE